MMGCQPTQSQFLAGLVCNVDPFCCTTRWDHLCVSEVPTEFWDAAEAALPPATWWNLPARQVAIATTATQAGSMTASGLTCVGSMPAGFGN